MGIGSSPAMFQSFLPVSTPAKAHVWKFSWQYAGRRPRHFHLEPELNLIIAGQATFGVGESTVTVSAGEVLGFAPGQDHVLLDASPDFYLFAIGIAPKLSAAVLGAERVQASVPLHMRLNEADFSELRARSEAIVDRTGVDGLGAELWEHANWVRRRAVERLNVGMHVLTRRTLELLASRPSLSRDAMARSLRVTPTAISRYFHQDVGMTLVKYRARMHLLGLIELVDRGSQNLVAVAESAGFGSYSQCHRVFQAELGCSPKQFFQAGVREQMERMYAP